MPFKVEPLRTRDGRFLRGGVWDVAPGMPVRGICVLLQGLTEYLEKYEETAGELTRQGFTVLSIDWRSQGASERRVGNQKGHVASFDEYDADLQAMILRMVQKRTQATPDIPVFALAHSMGGHILLRFLHDNSRRFACAVLLAPMLDVDTGRFTPWQTWAAATLFNLHKPSTRFVFGCEERDPLTLSFSENLLTSDEARYARNVAYLKAQPYLRICGPSFGWLGAALKSMRRMRSPRFIANITTPLLIFGAGNDKVVHVEAIREFAKHAPNARYVEIAEAKHEILMENDAIRARFWKEFDPFIDAQLSKGAKAFFTSAT
jgi:lysophospholipase